jgi:hypothetical protein
MCSVHVIGSRKRTDGQPHQPIAGDAERDYLVQRAGARPPAAGIHSIVLFILAILKNRLALLRHA